MTRKRQDNGGVEEGGRGEERWPVWSDTHMKMSF